MPPLISILAPSAGYGVERTALPGGAVIAVNHFSAIDPPLVGCYSHRAIYYLTKTELLAVPVAGEILRWTGAFAVKRGQADRDALRVARWLVRHGHVVGVFVEGTRQHTPSPGTAQPGAAMIALRERVPVIPCGIDTHGWTPRRRRACTLVWGTPLKLDHLPANGNGLKRATRLIQDELRRLWQLATNATTAGHPPTLPDGTHRAPTVRPWNGLPDKHAPPWPTEPWAAEPLGPLHHARRGERAPDVSGDSTSRSGTDVQGRRQPARDSAGS